MSFINYVCEKHDIKIIQYKNIPEDIKKQMDLKAGGGFVLNKEALGVDMPHTILYDEQRDRFETNFIVLHELGHILLGHTSGAEVNSNTMEMEASIFSAAVLAQIYYEEYKASLKEGKQEN